MREIPIWPLESYGDPDLLLIKVAACGVCGSDFRYFEGENPWAQHTLGKFVPNPPNIVLGHEYAGTVVAVQSEAHRHLLGKRVAPVCSKVCGACADCRNGRTRLCPNTVHMGHGQGWGEQSFYPGAYGRYTLAWASSSFEIADDLTFEEAAMMDILAVCVHVAEVGRVHAGRPVLCIGAGPAGNGVAQAAQAMGASRCALLDRRAGAIAIAEKQGVGVGIETGRLSDPELVSALLKIAPEGFGSVFDTVGTSWSINLGLAVLGKDATLVNMAVHDEEVPINCMSLGSERRIVTSCNFEVGDYPKALAWLEAGQFRVKEWQTRISLEETPSWFRQERSNEVFKLVIDPWA